MTIQAMEIIREIVFRNRDRHAIPPLDGTLNPNNILEELPVVLDSLDQPDDVAIDREGNLYLSEGNRVLVFSGEDYEKKSLLAEFGGKAGGLGFDASGRLMVCVGGIGLCLVDGAGGKTWIKEAGGTALRCPNSALAAPDGGIYITEGSTCHEPQDWIWDLMEKRATGRLIRYDPAGQRCQVLLSGLSYPYGVTLSHDGQAIVFSESWGHRLSCYPLGDTRPATVQVVLPNLPGYPGRIIPSSSGGYWLCLFALRTELVEFVLSEDKYRREMMRTIEPEHWIRPALSSGEDFLEPIQFGGIRVLGIKKPWAPPRSYGLVIELDENFQVLKSLHSRADGKRHGITGVAEHKGNLFILSQGHGVVLKSSANL